MDKDTIKINILMNFILTFSNFVFPLLSYGYVTRVLLVDGTGKVSFVSSIIGFSASIAALGIPNLGTRECAKVRDDKDKLSKLVHELFIINCISTLQVYIILGLLIYFIPKFHSYVFLFLIMAPSILLNTLGIEWLYRALERYTYITIRSILFKIVSVVLIFLLVRSPDDLIVYGGLTILATSASNLLNFFYARNFITLSRYSNYVFTPYIKPLMYFFATALIITIYGHLDVIMLGFIKGDTEVGLYNVGLKFKTLAISVSLAFTTVLLPRMSVYSYNNKEASFNSLLGNSLRLTCLLMFPIITFVFLNVKELIILLCGNAFIASFSTVALLNVSVLFISFANLLGNQILIPKGKEKVFFQSVTVSLVINVILNFLLIPFLGATGAAIATLGSEFFNVFWMGRHSIVEIKNLVHSVNVFMYVFSLFFAIVIALVLSYILPINNLIIRVFINAIVLFGTFYCALLCIKEPILLYLFDRLLHFKKAIS